MSPTLAVDRPNGRRLATAACLLALLALVAVLAASPLAVRAADHGVQIQDSGFGPSTLTVSVGDTVTWTNADSTPHTVSSEGGAFDSGNLDDGQAFSFTFTAPGTYAYRCNYHSDMTATIVVEAAGAAQPAIAPAVTAATGTPPTGEQPNTALPASGTGDAPVAPIVIGLGLLGLALGVVPARRHTAPVIRTGGWRR